MFGYGSTMPHDREPPKITRREVDSWLVKVETEVQSILKGPTGELRARLVLLERCVACWREKLGVKR